MFRHRIDGSNADDVTRVEAPPTPSPPAAPSTEGQLALPAIHSTFESVPETLRENRPVVFATVRETLGRPERGKQFFEMAT
jgi:hypothetical protein